MLPLKLLEPERFLKAPADENPDPLMDKDSPVIVTPPESCNEAPEFTIVPFPAVPRAPLFETSTSPAVTVVSPV